MGTESVITPLQNMMIKIEFNKIRDPLLHKFERFAVNKDAVNTALEIALRQYLRGIIYDVDSESMVPHARTGAICIGVSDDTTKTFNPLVGAQIFVRYIHSAGGPSIRLSQMLGRGETTLEYIQIPLHKILIDADDDTILSKLHEFTSELASKIMEIHARMEIHELSSVARKLRLKHMQSRNVDFKEEIVIYSFLYSDFAGVIYNPYE